MSGSDNTIRIRIDEMKARAQQADLREELIYVGQLRAKEQLKVMNLLAMLQECQSILNHIKGCGYDCSESSQKLVDEMILKIDERIAEE